MTSETRTTIDPSDVVAIEIECTNCHVRQVRPLGAERGRLDNCPNCNETWMTLGSSDAKNIFYLIQSLNDLKSLMESGKTPYRIRLEVKGLKP
jgi:hypothetical protein